MPIETDPTEVAAFAFADHILPEWESAMQRLFERLDKERKRRGLTVAQVHSALSVGYGGEIADHWDEWVA